ncbi:MAG: pyruvate kinase alpha/beta domain-containing protein [Candidatus Thorarchaeota archaeon]
MDQNMTIKTLYFDEASSEHTNAVFEVVEGFLSEHEEIRKVVVATTSGTTGAAAAKRFSKHDVIVVSHHTGFSAPNENELDESERMSIEKSGAKLLTTTHAFAGVARGIRKDVGTWTPTEMMAIAYRTFCEGTKVCAEIAMMTADAGLVRVNEDVVCIAGTGFGADTAWLVTPANTNRFPELKMKACICKPLKF